MPQAEMRIKEIWIHPVKSMKGIKLDKCQIDSNGFKYDRMYMLAEPDKKATLPDEQYRFVTQREAPRMTLIETSIDIERGHLKLVYPPTGAELLLPLQIDSEILKSMPSKDAFIWNQTPTSYDLQYDFPAIRPFIESVFYDEPERAAEATFVAPKDRRTVKRGSPDEQTLNRRPTTSFQDYYPGNVITTSSLEDLYNKVYEKTKGEIQIGVRNFRPNIVVETEIPWDEDTWKTIKIGGKYTWHIACRNVRCQITTVNLKSGQFEKSHEPYKTMQSFRRVDPGAPYLPCFGMNMVHQEVGYTISTGDTVEVLGRGEHIYEKI
ncbi:Molybdenum cofactor sulfurase [Sugiyamaella lignohabitans]|uniref:Molybdenum cofactor sulfurase n=1 Tax=Sugiyamaella lignohabitans TaxID=796027 RepID=A0A167FV11_9ASCO|nr:Molybdenum cofactor sulfurase [Sugiyamaella lignohabitans]ANB15734.1 Molybdenum cofactor sulfurase [Sugiyamaella lignohabitans]